MPSGGRSPDTVALTMTEDAKTEENTAGALCGAYIERPASLRLAGRDAYLSKFPAIQSAI